MKYTYRFIWTICENLCPYYNIG